MLAEGEPRVLDEALEIVTGPRRKKKQIPRWCKTHENCQGECCNEAPRKMIMVLHQNEEEYKHVEVDGVIDLGSTQYDMSNGAGRR